ncbi:MAG TPA: response regulator, partial [Bacteroidales bacterium]|nr:response regulator [Bacteroidales bacterium]
RVLQDDQMTVMDLKGKNVLVVEDVDSNFDLLKIILESLGMNVIRAIEGHRAIQICEETEQLDLVLMDIQLPGMNGYEATRVIKQIRPELPVIAQTAFAMTNEKDACLEAGCDGYIAKPIKSQLLIPVLQQILFQ